MNGRSLKTAKNLQISTTKVFVTFFVMFVCGLLKGTSSWKKVKLKWKSVKNAKKRAIADLNAPHYDIKPREMSKELFRVYSEMRSKKDWTLANIQ